MAWLKTPSGYAITSARITRAGDVEYYGHELGLFDQANKKFTITRTMDELTKPETLASFEGQTLTLTHPDSGAVSADEWRDKAIGHIQNVRAEGNYLVCDAYIKDAAAIDVLKQSGVREVSCGYEPAEIVERNGKLYQINIRGNHVAVVASARLGPDCRLNDKQGKPMKKYTLKSMIAALKGRLSDADGDPLSEEELTGMIAALESTLADLEAIDAPDDETQQKIQDTQDQLNDLKAQLEALKKVAADTPPPQNDDDPDADPAATTDDKDLRIQQLEKENADLKQQVADLQAQLDKLKGDQETEAVLTDAKARFPKVDVSKARNARAVREIVLKQSGVFTDSAVKAMTDAEIRAAYAAAQAVSKPRSTIGSVLLGDSKPKPTKTASQRLGGK